MISINKASMNAQNFNPHLLLTCITKSINWDLVLNFLIRENLHTEEERDYRGEEHGESPGNDVGAIYGCASRGTT